MIKEISYASLTDGVPAEWKPNELRQQINETNRLRNKKIVVLDDDPTGVQTVHNIDVLTKWDKGLIKEAFESKEEVFYILTNTRGYEAHVVEQMNREIAQNVHVIADELGIDFAFVSRSDSTLRGYYPLEVDVLSDEISLLTGKGYDGHFIIPAFFEGGRITYKNTHYIVEGDGLTPAHETEFAKDKVFGYENGDLTKWVAEKTNGRFKAEDCVVISLDEIRQGPEKVVKKLLDIEGNIPIIVNCLSYADMDVLSMAILQAEAQGKRFIFRTGASFVKSYGGFEQKGYLPKEKLVSQDGQHHGGLVIVGSYVQKTTRQLDHLLNNSEIESLEVDVRKILEPVNKEKEIDLLSHQLNQLLSNGSNVVLYSSRKLIAAETKEENLKINQTVSDTLVQLVQSLEITPKFIIAKGGITSSDVATKGLSIRKARVLGQVAAGIPVWLTGKEAKFANVAYIIFPGNVGGEDELLNVYRRLV